MKNSDPRVKLLCILLATTLALVFTDALWMLGLCVCVVILCAVFGADYKSFFMKLRRFVPLLLGVSVLQIIFVRTGASVWTIGDFVVIYYDGLMRGVTMAMRFFILMCSAAVMAAENSRRVIASLSKMKIPYTFSFMMMLALRFIPFFSESFSDAMISIQLRGVELEKVKIGKKIRLYGHLLLPVVADAVVKSQDMSIAMEARGFGAMKKRTSYIDIRLSARDIVTMITLIVLTSVSIYLYAM